MTRDRECASVPRRARSRGGVRRDGYRSPRRRRARQAPGPSRAEELLPARETAAPLRSSRAAAREARSRRESGAACGSSRRGPHRGSSRADRRPRSAPRRPVRSCRSTRSARPAASRSSIVARSARAPSLRRPSGGRDRTRPPGRACACRQGARRTPRPGRHRRRAPQWPRRAGSFRYRRGLSA